MMHIVFAFLTFMFNMVGAWASFANAFDAYADGRPGIAAGFVALGVFFAVEMSAEARTRAHRS